MKYKSIPDFPGYRASNDGVIWTCWQRFGLGPGNGSTFVQGKNWRPLTTRPDRDGYLHVRLCRDGKKYYPMVHRLVLLAFAGLPLPGHQSRHRNGNKQDNRRRNLRWGTVTDNNRDRIRHGTIPRGENNKTAKLTVAAVQQIRRIHRQQRQGRRLD